MSWKTNAMMEWDGRLVTDHNRSPLEVSIERIEKKQRMVDGTLRRYTVSKKRTFSCSWELLPSHNRADFLAVMNVDHQPAARENSRQTLIADQSLSTTEQDTLTSVLVSFTPNMPDPFVAVGIDTVMAAKDITEFHDNTDGPFWVTLREGDGESQPVLCMISDFSSDITKRGKVQYGGTGVWEWTWADDVTATSETAQATGTVSYQFPVDLYNISITLEEV